MIFHPWAGTFGAAITVHTHSSTVSLSLKLFLHGKSNNKQHQE